MSQKKKNILFHKKICKFFNYFINYFFFSRDFTYPSDSDDDKPKRSVRAYKDKMYEELKEHIRMARNARNIKDASRLFNCKISFC